MAKSGKQNFVAVRWPADKRQQLKVAAAKHNESMGDYLVDGFVLIEQHGGLAAIKALFEAMARCKS